MSDGILDKAMERMRLLSRHYAMACHVPCSVITTAAIGKATIKCPLWNTEGQCAGCHEDIERNFRQSLRFGGSYVFFCGGSFMFWASPLIIQSKVLYGLVAGPVLVLPRQEIDDAILRKMGDAIRKIPRKNPAAVTSLAEVLRMVAGWASEYQDTLTASYRNLTLQGRLFDELQEEKEDGEGRGRKMLYFPETERELYDAIVAKDMESARNAVDRELWLFSHYHPGDERALRIRLQELVTLFSRAALKGHADEALVWSLCQRLYGSLAFQRSPEEGIRRIRDALSRFVSLVSEPVARRGEALSPATEKVVAWANKAFAGHLSLSDAADVAGVSEHYFCRLFRKDTGKTWVEYLTGLRMGKAREMLLATTAPVAAISEACGFSSQAAFAKVFRKSEGLSPSSFRKRNFHLREA